MSTTATTFSTSLRVFVLSESPRVELCIVADAVVCCRKSCLWCWFINAEAWLYPMPRDGMATCACVPQATENTRSSLYNTASSTLVVFYDGNEQVLAKFLAPPGRLADLLAIAGDKSDGIVGAEGYGPVKAAKVRGHYRGSGGVAHSTTVVGVCYTFMPSTHGMSFSRRRGCVAERGDTVETKGRE